jgi:hypothetical protein
MNYAMRETEGAAEMKTLYFVMLAIALTLIAVAAARADQYGFADAPYSYDRENSECAWSDAGSGRRYRPGYSEDSRRARCEEGRKK